MLKTRILFAWEMGANLGHLTRDLPLARACRDAGYEVFMAVNNLNTATTLLGQEGFTLLQVPVLRPLPGLPPPINFASMLLQQGYQDTPALNGALQGWLSLLKLIQPQAMVYNHAPTALLAARLMDVPVLLIGTGFEIPPEGTPLPSFMPWKAIPLATHIEVEQRLLGLLNPILSKHRKPSISNLSELLLSHSPLLTTFSGLDPFGPRHNAHYIGPLYALPEVPEINWQQPKRPHILIYLRPGILGVEALLEALQSMDAEIICAVPGLPREWSRRFPNLRFYPHAVNLSQLLPASRLMICYGAGTIGTSLLAGVPVLVIPQMTEQYLTGLALERLGAGMMLHQDRSVAHCKSVLHQLLSKPDFRAAAHNFAQGHTRFSVQDAVQKLWQALHVCLNRSPAPLFGDTALTLTSAQA